MKYMGSKRAMLRNGLGELLNQEVPRSKRFVDLFTGSASVASFVACKHDVPVLATDLQKFSVVLAQAQITRDDSLSASRIWSAWLTRATSFAQKFPRRIVDSKVTKRSVARHRDWSEGQAELPLTSAYGGHYFSAHQALWIDALRATLPTKPASKRVALASLIRAASFCSASPGHTAQPFQPTETAIRYVAEAWSRDIIKKTREELESLCSFKANRIGTAYKADANLAAKTLGEGDLAFLDPPYSGVHYSRFYHVLESIARGGVGEVTGSGRYPSEAHRPRSRYSVASESQDALDDLLRTLSDRGAKVIMTFPDHKCSNGLSGYAVRGIASNYFHVDRKSVASRFSSLGGRSDNLGNEAGRSARVHARELVLTLVPKG